MKVLVAYDGTLQSKDALRYGMEKVRENGGEVLALHLFNSNLFIDYDVAPGAVETARKESARQIQDAKILLKEEGSDLKTSIFAGEGDPEDEVIRFARERNVDVLLCPPRYKSIIKKFRKVAEEGGREARENSILDEAERLKMAVVSVR
jgi:nucleotide-binding universal stress UspA family protein